MKLFASVLCAKPKMKAGDKMSLDQNAISNCFEIAKILKGKKTDEQKIADVVLLLKKQSQAGLQTNIDTLKKQGIEVNPTIDGAKYIGWLNHNRRNDLGAGGKKN
jgi:hypothetical protein